MKVLIFIHSLSAGGAERVASNLANQWASNGWEVTLVTVASTSTDFYRLNASVIRVGLNLDISEDSVSPSKAILNKLARVIALRRILRKVQPEIAIAILTEANLTLTLANWGMASTLSIGSERSYPPQVAIGKIRTLLRTWLYRRLDAVVALTDRSAVWLKEHTHAKLVAVIPNPIVWPLPAMPPAIPLPDTNRKMLLAAGRLSPEKQFDLLIRVFSRLASKLSDWDLLILGDGAQRPSLETLVRHLNLQDRVTLPGRAGNLSQWYEAADLFVLCSRFEGFPNTIAEAMAYGVPVVSFDCATGPRDIIRHEVDGLLVAPNDEQGLETTLFELANDEAKRQQLASRCPDVRERFSLQAIDRQWKKLFRELQG